jgi:hypothetical protein
MFIEGKEMNDNLFFSLQKEEVEPISKVFSLE